MYKLSLPLYLSSASPRRKMLLRQFGFVFRKAASHVSEQCLLKSPGPRSMELAARKAIAAGKGVRKGIILGFDTLVFLRGAILEKPRGPAEARAMLRNLSGATHTVYTGMAMLVKPGKRIRLHCEKTKVTFRKLEEKEIKNYISTGDPFDKAGAYGIQGLAGSFVEKVSGCFFNVVGLPVKPLMDRLKPYIRG
jgi:septum formation protein